jgi:hypothetical protein
MTSLTNWLVELGWPAHHAMTPISGGRNNRVFRLEVAEQALLLKQYFRHPDDPRDRLTSEYRFLTAAWSRGIRCIPEPIAEHATLGVALYGWVHGRKLTPTEVQPKHVHQAMAFVRSLNSPRETGIQRHASEACFSLQDHLQTIARRVQRLRTIQACSPIHIEAKQWIEQEFSPFALHLIAYARWKAQQLGLDLSEPLPVEDRCLSPSDFGFHNALIQQDDLTFLDFEYAGEDDPAKLLCDFYCQPAIPAPRSTLPNFLQLLGTLVANPQHLYARVEILKPIYQVKWICIILNEFLPVSQDRRAFAEAEATDDSRRLTQLDLARRSLLELRGRLTGLAA